jgi:glycolate oxidase iron-sulfur subunit
LTPDQLLELSDHCVKCGFCLPHCPTFGKLANEADSPRGRIALIQGWASGQLELSPKLAGHLDGCLQCRACEQVCPSLVAYGRLADGAKAARVYALSGRRQAFLRTPLAWLSDSRASDWLARAAKLYRRLGLARLAELGGLAQRLGLGPIHRLTAAISDSAAPVTPSEPLRADLELFVGCMGGLAQGRAVGAAQSLCTRMALRVRVPATPACCGALLRHNGFPKEADARRSACARPSGAPPLVGLSSACVAELREGPGTADAWELCDYLDRQAPLDRLALRPIPGLVLVHEPCSHRNLLGGNGAVYRLLARIPGLVVLPLPDNATCCGAAGTYMLAQPAMAELLRADKIAAIAALAPATVVTTNGGCALHLLAGLRAAGLATQVCHPVELLERSCALRVASG